MAHLHTLACIDSNGVPTCKALKQGAKAFAITVAKIGEAQRGSRPKAKKKARRTSKKGRK